METVAFQASRSHTIKLEINDFEQILLAEIEDVDDPSGEFWEEVAGRVANTLKQAMMLLQEKQDFPPFSLIHVATNSLRPRNFVSLLNRHFSLTPLFLWDLKAAAQIDRYYEEEFATVVDGLSTIIEPLMFVFVGVMLVALYLPIFSAGNAIK